MQRIISGGYKNSRRTLAIACYGLIWNGPSAHFWQKFMEYLFPGKTDMKTVLKKVRRPGIFYLHRAVHVLPPPASLY